MSVEVQVVQMPRQGFWDSVKELDTSGVPLILDRFLKSAIPIRNFEDMNRILGSIYGNNGQSNIDLLVINGHGSNFHFRIGDDMISMDNINNHKNNFDHLRILLYTNAVVQIASCRAAETGNLMRKVSEMLGGIPVIGYDGLQSGGLPPSGPPTIFSPGGSYRPAAPASGVNKPNPPLPSQ